MKFSSFLVAAAFLLLAVGTGGAVAATTPSGAASLHVVDSAELIAKKHAKKAKKKKHAKKAKKPRARTAGR